MATTVGDGKHTSSSSHLIGVPEEASHTTLMSTAGTKRRHNRPVPSPLQESTTVRSASDASPLTPTRPTVRAALSQDQIPTASPLAGERLRAPNPAKKASGNPDDLRSAVTRDAIREQEARKAIVSTSQSRNVSAPVLGAAPQISPPTSPTMISSSSQAARSADPRSIDGRPIMPRTASIDSTVSSISSSTTTSQRPNGTGAYRVSQEGAGPQDVTSLIASSGSAEAAVQKLLNEKNQAASHNAQLWRLVEKQRAMILGLNKDLEKSLKEKERYRRKLKDHLVQSQSAPVLPTVGGRAGEQQTRDESESPLLLDLSRDVALVASVPASLREISLDSRKVSDTSDAASIGPGRSDTPQDTAVLSSSGLPATPKSTGSGETATREERSVAALGPVQSDGHGHIAAAALARLPASTPPLSPRSVDAPHSPKSPVVQNQKPTAVITTLSTPAQGVSSPKSATRKAPPAPLQLSPRPIANVTNNLIDPSDAEYEEDPDSARAEQMIRGRRKTREEDDREREALALQEEEHRSRSKKEKKSKSKPPTEKSELPIDQPSHPAPQPTAVQPMPDQTAKAQAHPSMADPVAILRQRALSDAAGMLQKSSTAPALMSPGLPISPRPIDKPLNSPMPRAPNKMLNSIPLSPRAGIPAGLPLSPRAPRQPIPLPAQTPLTFASPHLARAEAYHTQAQAQQGSIADRLNGSPDASPAHERPSTSSDPNPKSPGEVYRGLVTEHYPDLLLPPNALPSIFIKTSSSRMKPSRLSYVAPKHADETSVLTLAVYERAERKQLWRIEKTLAALALLDSQIKAFCNFRDRLPDKALFSGHAPAKIDARRAAVDTYFDRMLDSVQDEKAARVVCKFLSTDAIGSETGDYFARNGEARPDTPVAKSRQQKAGYLTKRGKNFGGWKARYFVLDGPNLKYFEAPGGAHLGSIKLQNAQIGKQSAQAAPGPQEDEDNQFRHAFLILEPKKKDSSSLVRHVLCAESDEERDAWVEVLLQYVDFRDEDEEPSQGTQFVRPGPDISGARSPRLQKSMNDLRPPSRGKEAQLVIPDHLRAVGYNETVAGEAPVIGPAATRKVGTPSPPYDATFSNTEQTSSTHPTISGPTNLQVISNAGDWGMRPPPTPSAKEHGKDKKRGMFAAFRGRSSSDLAPGLASPALPPEQRSHTGGRAVFGVPLAEAVEFAHPIDATTELPAVVYRCIEYLTVKHAIAEEGIFRLSGSNTVIKSLKDRFNSEGDVNLAAEDKYYDIHAVASLLKLYLRELPSSILTRDLHLEFLHTLELHNSEEKIVRLNALVNQLPRPNRALLQALSAFLLSIVNNADVNKMNVRNVGIVFSPTLNVPGPLISSFVEEQEIIFGPLIDDAESPVSATEITAPQPLPTDLRSPRKQMFSDLPTPAYHQTSFQGFGALHDTGMMPMQPSYTNYQMAPQGEGGFGSLNDALRSPTVYSSAANGTPTPRDIKSKRRESAMMLGPTTAPHKKTSMSRLREEEGARF